MCNFLLNYNNITVNTLENVSIHFQSPLNTYLRGTRKTRRAYLHDTRQYNIRQENEHCHGRRSTVRGDDVYIQLSKL